MTDTTYEYWKSASSNFYSEEEEKAPCPRHDPIYEAVPGLGGMYLHCPHMHCMRCNTTIGSSTHNYQCYTDEDARWVANGVANEAEDSSGKYDLNDHEIYHFANDLTKLAIAKDNFNTEDVKKTLLNTKANMYKCTPSYNPYREIDWTASKKMHLASNEPNDAELKDATSKRIDIIAYGHARRYGANHNETLDAHSKGIYLYDYGYARRSDATHKETLDAHSKSINLYDYGFARSHGYNHKEILDAHSKGIHIYDYSHARACGANHNEILDAHSKDINLSDYGRARESGATHKEILDAHSKGIDIIDYGYARNHGYNHEQAIRKQMPNYNPYLDIDWKSSSREFY